MPILFALAILGFAVYTLDALQTSFHGKVQKRSIGINMAAGADLQLALGVVVKKAYDEGRALSGCPANTSLESGVGSSDFPLCWRDSQVVGGCFNHIQFRGRTVCFADDQNVLAKLTPTQKMYAWLDSQLVSQAQAAPNLREPLDFGDYSLGMHVTAAAPAVAGGPNAQAFVRLPEEEFSNEVRGNFIQCGQDHTECFTIVFCLNGIKACTGEERFASTFAVRHY